MKTIIAIILSLCFIGCVPLSTTSHQPLEQEKIRHYDKKGSYKGYTIVNKYGMRHYDEKGRFVGTSK